MDKKLSSFLIGLSLIALVFFLNIKCSNDDHEDTTSNSSVENNGIINLKENESYYITLNKDNSFHFTLPDGSDKYEPEIARNGELDLIIQVDGTDRVWRYREQPLKGIYYKSFSLRLPQDATTQTHKIKIGCLNKQKL